MTGDFRFIVWWFIGPLFFGALFYQVKNFNNSIQILFWHWASMATLLVGIWTLRISNNGAQSETIANLARMYITLTSLFASMNYSLYRFEPSSFTINFQTSLEEIVENTENKIENFHKHYRLLLSLQKILLNESQLENLTNLGSSKILIGEDEINFNIRTQAYEKPTCVKNADASCAGAVSAALAISGTWLDISSHNYGALAQYRLSESIDYLKTENPEIKNKISEYIASTSKILNDLLLENDARSEISFRVFWFESALFFSGSARPLIFAEMGLAMWLQVFQGFSMVLILGFYLRKAARISEKNKATEQNTGN